MSGFEVDGVSSRLRRSNFPEAPGGYGRAARMQRAVWRELYAMRRKRIRYLSIISFAKWTPETGRQTGVIRPSKPGPLPPSPLLSRPSTSSRA